MESRHTVLLAEDEEALRNLLYNSLVKWGFKVLEAATGTEALLLSERFSDPIDLLLADVILPGLSGPELAAAVRARRPAIAVLFMSGYTQDLALGADASPRDAGFISKPFEPAELLDRIGELVGHNT